MQSDCGDVDEPAARAEARRDSNLPERVAGLDIRGGVSRVGGNALLYCELLLEFERTESDAADRVNKALDGGDIDLAVQGAHGIKGLAGNLSAPVLHGAAAEFESALREPGSASLELLKDRFESALSEAMASIRSLDLAERLTQSTTPACAPTMSAEELRAGIHDLSRLIDEHNLGAEECLNGIAERADLSEHEAETAALRRHLAELDFGGAQNALSVLATSLGFENPDN